MRFAILVKATESSKAGGMPTEEVLNDVVEYHEELEEAGALYDAAGLRPTREGWRIRYSGDARTVIDGPFARATEHPELKGLSGMHHLSAVRWRK